MDGEIAQARRHIGRALRVDRAGRAIRLGGLRQLALAHLRERQGHQAEDAGILYVARLLFAALKVARVAQVGRQVLAIERTASAGS